MMIDSVFSDRRVATITVDASELVKLCNVLYHAPEEQRNALYHKLYSDLLLVRDICQYGNIDAFCLERIVEHRKHSQKPEGKSDDQCSTD